MPPILPIGRRVVDVRPDTSHVRSSTSTLGGIERVTPPADEVSTMLDAIQVRSVVYCRSELGAPWGFRVAGSPRAKFHLVLSGAALLDSGTAEPAPLGSGDLALLPHGSGHVMRDRSTSRVRHLDRILEDHPVDASGTMRYGGGGQKT